MAQSYALTIVDEVPPALGPLGWGRVLVLAPHVDDEIPSAGTLSRAVRGGASVHVSVFTDPASLTPHGGRFDQLENELVSSLECICGAGGTYNIDRQRPRRLQEHRQAVLDEMRRVAREFSPDVVICPSSTDCHQDHATVHREAIRVFRNSALVLGWETPNNQRESRLNWSVAIDTVDLDAKRRAHACYESQRRRTWMDWALFDSLATVRGRQFRTPTGLAEAFELIAGNV